jgi:hypothetical protein
MVNNKFSQSPSVPWPDVQDSPSRSPSARFALAIPDALDGEKLLLYRVVFILYT